MQIKCEDQVQNMHRQHNPRIFWTSLVVRSRQTAEKCRKHVHARQRHTSSGHMADVDRWTCTWTCMQMTSAVSLCYCVWHLYASTCCHATPAFVTTARSRHSLPDLALRRGHTLRSGSLWRRCHLDSSTTLAFSTTLAAFLRHSLRSGFAILILDRPVGRVLD